MEWNTILQDIIRHYYDPDIVKTPEPDKNKTLLIKKKSRLCGDAVSVWNVCGKLFVGASGCALCKASAALLHAVLMEQLKNMHNVQTEVRALCEWVCYTLSSEADMDMVFPVKSTKETDIRNLMLVKNIPARLSCVLLPWQAMLQVFIDTQKNTAYSYTEEHDSV